MRKLKSSLFQHQQPVANVIDFGFILILNCCIVSLQDILKDQITSDIALTSHVKLDTYKNKDCVLKKGTHRRRLLVLPFCKGRF